MRNPFKRTSLALSLLTLISACTQTTPQSSPTPTPRVHLAIAASPTAQTRLLQWVELYQEEHPEIVLEVLPSSAAQAQQSLAQGKADLAFLDQEPATAYQGVLTTTLVATEPIAIIVHPDNTLDNLTSMTLAELLGGRIMDWSQVGGTSGPVQIYLLPDSAGEVQSFARQAMAGRHLSNQALVRPSPSSIRQAVAQDRGGIALLADSDVAGEISILQVDGIFPIEDAYPWHMPLFLAYGPNSPPSAHAFVRFVRLLEREP